LNIQYSKKKEEIRKDPVMEWLLSVKSFFAGNQRNLAIGGGTVLVIVAIAALVSWNTGKRKAEAQEIYGKAMIAFQRGNLEEAQGIITGLIDKYGSTPQAGYGSFLLGTINYRQEKYDEAIKWFEVASRIKNHTAFVPGGALEQIASCYEAKGDLEKSLSYLKEALADPNAAFRFPAIRWKLALQAMELNKTKEAQDFCTQIVSDTTAGEFRQKARNLLLEIQS
jgi:tetratricopeptide (TPR) repeat protein